MVTSNEVACPVFEILSYTRRRRGTILLFVLFVPFLEMRIASFSAESSFKHLILTYFHAFHADGIERLESEFPKFPPHGGKRGRERARRI